MAASKGWPLTLPGPADAAGPPGRPPAAEEGVSRPSRVGVDSPIPSHTRLLVIAGSATLAFGLTALALSLLTGAPLTVPTERMSRAIGINYFVPFAAGVLAYGLTQAARLRFRFDRTDARVIWENIRTDACFLTLFVIVIYFHFHIKMWVPVVNPALFDAFYFDLDNRLRFVIEVLDTARRWTAPLLPNPDQWYQGGFILLFMLALCFHSVGDRRFHYCNLIAILLVEILGALAYLVAPAIGPFIYENGLNAGATAAQAAMYETFRQVQQLGTAWLAAHGGEYFTGPPAAMPSLHIAVAWIITYYAFKARLVIFPLSLLLLTWFVIEAVAARWHYLVDLPAGVALAIVVIAVTNRICRQPDDAAPPRGGSPRP